MGLLYIQMVACLVPYSNDGNWTPCCHDVVHIRSLLKANINPVTCIRGNTLKEDRGNG